MKSIKESIDYRNFGFGKHKNMRKLVKNNYFSEKSHFFKC